MSKGLVLKEVATTPETPAAGYARLFLDDTLGLVVQDDAGVVTPFGAVGIATGGLTGQLLAKTSATDYDTEWIDPPSSLGDVVGPASAVSGNIATFDGATGKLIQDGGVTIADFATAAQGSLADTALQPADVGTAAAEDVGAFATAAQGALADSALQPGDPISINAQTGTTYTLVLTDIGKLVTLSNAGAITLTVPTNASVAFPVGTVIALAQLGAGLVTVAGDTGVTINGVTPGDSDLSGQYATASLTKLATDTWLLSGGLA